MGGDDECMKGRIIGYCFSCAYVLGTLVPQRHTTIRYSDARVQCMFGPIMNYLIEESIECGCRTLRSVTVGGTGVESGGVRSFFIQPTITAVRPTHSSWAWI